MKDTGSQVTDGNAKKEKKTKAVKEWLVGELAKAPRPPSGYLFMIWPMSFAN